MENREILQYITELNNKAERLNKQREQALGAMQAAKSTFERMAQQYEQMYGTAVNIDNLEEEFQKVKNDVVERAKILEKQIQSIERGEYKSEN